MDIVLRPTILQKGVVNWNSLLPVSDSGSFIQAHSFRSYLDFKLFHKDLWLTCFSRLERIIKVLSTDLEFKASTPPTTEVTRNWYPQKDPLLFHD